MPVLSLMAFWFSSRAVCSRIIVSLLCPSVESAISPRRPVHGTLSVLLLPRPRLRLLLEDCRGPPEGEGRKWTYITQAARASEGWCEARGARPVASGWDDVEA